MRRRSEGQASAPAARPRGRARSRPRRGAARARKGATTRPGPRHRAAGRTRRRGRSRCASPRARAARRAAGFLGAAWPKEYGGAGLSPMEQAILNEELARARAPQVVNAMAIWWVGLAIIRYGTDAQKQRFIPPILTADEIWATGYSEPSSGSDMAAAKTRAVRDGDDYVVNGQKIWTTLAHISDWFFILVRTSADGPKWAGLSVLLMDMRSRGIELRPIRQIDGRSEVNEVFMTDVRAPAANRLGADGQGWEIVSSALVNERSGIAGSIRFDQALDWLKTTARERQKLGDRRVRQQVADRATKAASMRWAGMRALTDSLHARTT